MSRYEYRDIFLPLADLETYLQKRQGSDWLPIYVGVLEEYLDNAIEAAHSDMNRSIPRRPVHFHRRIIAIYHEALDLYSQGDKCFDTAEEDDKLVIHGCG
jgi:hypothetical protein